MHFGLVTKNMQLGYLFKVHFSSLIWEKEILTQLSINFISERLLTPCLRWKLCNFDGEFLIALFIYYNICILVYYILYTCILYTYYIYCFIISYILYYNIMFSNWNQLFRVHFMFCGFTSNSQKQNQIQNVVPA